MNRRFVKDGEESHADFVEGVKLAVEEMRQVWPGIGALKLETQ